MDDKRSKTSVRDLARLLRPGQWTKNAIVLAAFIFAFGDSTRSEPLTWFSLLKACAAAALFCAASSGVYVLNDVRDVKSDREHPLKKNRPIAAGNVPVTNAVVLGLLLLGLGCAGGWLLSPAFAGVLGSYIALQTVYTWGLKQVALVDVLVIAAGFVLRALAGAVVLDLTISPWLLLCTFLLALFLALCKRRHEKILLQETAGNHRASLEDYDRKLLDQLISSISGATIVAYSIYTLAPQTVAKFGSERLAFTIPFVVFGVFRYLDLVYRCDGGGRPEKILLTDTPLIIDLALYGLALVALLAMH